MLIPCRLLTVLVLLTFSLCVQSIQLSGLFSSTDYQWEPLSMLRLTNNTLLLTASSTSSVSELSLHPSVTTDDAPPRFGETNLVARVHASNSTVAWADARSTFENFVAAATDHLGCVYLAGAPDNQGTDPSALQLVKYDADGARGWLRRFSSNRPQNALPPRVFVKLAGSLQTLFVANGLLLLPGQKRESGVMSSYLLAFSTSTGDFLYSFQFPDLPGVAPRSVESISFAVGGLEKAAACFVFTESYGPTGDGSRLFVQCAPIGGRRAVLRALTGLDEGVRISYASATIVDGDSMDSAPVLHVAYERMHGLSVTAPEGMLNATHEMVVHRLDTSTLLDVVWGGRTGPLLLKFPTPLFNDAELQPWRMVYIPRLDSIALLVSMYGKWDKVKQKSDGNVAIEGMRGRNAALTWRVLFFGKQRKFAHRLLKPDPRKATVQEEFNHLLVRDMALSQDEFQVHVYGMLERMVEKGGVESGPLFVHTLKLRAHEMVGTIRPAASLPPSRSLPGLEPSQSLGPEAYVEASLEPTAQASVEPFAESSAEPLRDPFMETSGGGEKEAGKGWTGWVAAVPSATV